MYSVRYRVTYNVHEPETHMSSTLSGLALRALLRGAPAPVAPAATAAA